MELCGMQSIALADLRHAGSSGTEEQMTLNVYVYKRNGHDESTAAFGSY